MAHRPLRFAVVLFVLLALGIWTNTTILPAGDVAESAELVANGPVDGTKAMSAPQGGPYALVLVVDAARFDEIDLSHMPNLARLVAGGTVYRRAWVGQLPSITETSHATIGTGTLPRRHLILGETWRIPGKNEMSPNLLSAQLDRTGYIGNLIKATHVPSLASIIHQQYPGSIVVALSGHKIYAADALGAGSADYVAFGGLDARKHYVPGAVPGHAPAQSIMKSPQIDLPSYPRTPGLEDWWTTTLAEKFLFKYHPRLMMVNLPEVDIVGHAVGTNPAVIGPMLTNVDRQLGRLLAAYGRAGLLSQTYFVIVSDHAMVPAQHTVSVDLIDAIIRKAGGQSLYVGHGDLSQIWLKNPSAIPQVAVALAKANLPNVAAVYAHSSTGQYTLVSSPDRLADASVNGSYADMLATFNSPESPDVVLLYDENTITMTPTLQRQGRKGDHGGATWGAQHIPLILAGPEVRQAYVSDYPARLVDIAPTLEILMGAHPQGQDGIPLADSMLHPPSWAAAAQNGASRLWSDVSGLEREALARPNLTGHDAGSSRHPHG